MRAVVVALLLAVGLLADSPAPQRGAKGGCYVVMTSKKTGKTYKRYVDKAKCGVAK